VEKLEEALQIKPESVAVLETLGPIESMRNHASQAEDYFNRLLKINPANSVALQGLKELKLRKDAGPAKGAKALETRKLLESMEETARGHEERKQWPAARQSWGHIVEKAVEAGARDRLADGYRGMARCEAQLRRKEEALKYLEKALATGSSKDATFRALADLHLRHLGKPDQAADYYRRHLAALGSESKADPGVYLNLARILSSGSQEESIEFFEKAVDLGILEILGPDSAGVKKDMGLLYVRLGRWQRAFDSLSGYHESLGADKAEERLVIEEILNEHVLPNLVGEQKKKGGGG
jgi:tetratricopeptide (TPR) repeat protein